MFVFAAALLLAQDPISQSDYEAFKRCQGDLLGHYRAGIVAFSGDNEAVARVHEAAKPMNDFLLELDGAALSRLPGLDAQAGYAVYVDAMADWNDWPDRPNARREWTDADPMTDRCRDAINKVAAAVDAR